MKRIGIFYHSKTGNTQQLVDALYLGLTASADIEVIKYRAITATAAELRSCSAIILATPENFGTMSGALKHFFDETYYEVENDNLALPYMTVISAKTDGSGASREITRIMTGYRFSKMQSDIIIKNPINQEDLAKLQSVGEAISTAISMGMY